MPKGIPKNGVNKGWFRKGKLAWNDKKNIKICPICNREFKSSPWWKRKYCSQKCYDKWQKGKHHSPGTEFKKGRKEPKGQDSPNWKGGRTSFNKRERNSLRFKNWRKVVFERDNYTCWICGLIGHKLHPHHLKDFANYLKLRFVINNGMTLCEFCHRVYTDFGK